MQTKTKPRKATSKVKHEAMINDAPKLLEAFASGDVSHQGDILIVGIAELPKSAKPRKNRQLADGNTQGSRHVLERGHVYDCSPAEVIKAVKAANGCKVEAQYIGPVFVSPEKPTENDLTHPEHGNQGFPAGQVCAVVYQRNLDSEQRAQRARD